VQFALVKGKYFFIFRVTLGCLIPIMR